MLSFLLCVVLSLTYYGSCSGTEPVPRPVPNSMNNVCNCHCNLPLSSDENRKTCAINETVLENVVRKENKQLKEELKKCIAQSPNAGTTFDLLFSNRGTSDYLIKHDLQNDLTAFTISLWMRSTDRTNSPHAGLFSYATSTGSDNTLLLISTENLRFNILGQEKVTSMKLNDGQWHHVAFTWENSAGAWSGYKDGIQILSGTGFKKGGALSKTGTLVLGQEQDSVGGGFHITQAYIGLMTQVNLWDKVLSQQEIALLNQNSYSGNHGNILKWDESLFAGLRGNIKVMRPSSCTA